MIRDAHPDELDSILALNNEAVPAVNPLDVAALAQLADWADRLQVVEDGERLVAFLLGLSGPGLPYASLNYRWFSERYPSFLYVDRVVVAAEAQGRGLGRALYDDLARYGRGRFPVLCAEVNVRPPNPRSLDFHAAAGFEGVGEQDTEGGTKRVRLLARDLRPQVLFLCTGNAARSVMAAAMAKARTERAVFTSSGTHSIEGLPMSARTRRALQRHGVHDPRHRSRQLTAADAAAADLIVGFEDDHIEYVRRCHPDAAGRAVIVDEVADPAGGDDATFVGCAAAVDRVVDRLIADLPTLLHGNAAAPGDAVEA